MPSLSVASPWRTEAERREDRESQRESKREAVLGTAVRLFLAKGYQGTSLDDVAAALDVSKPTLYHYIRSKEEILFACVHSGLAALQAAVQASDATGQCGRDRLEAVMRRYVAVVLSDPGQCVIRIGEEPLIEASRQALRDLRAQIDTAFARLIEAGMADGWIAPGDAGMAAHAVVGALGGLGRWHDPQRHGEADLAHAIDHSIRQLMRGVLAPPAAAPGRPAQPNAAPMRPTPSAADRQAGSTAGTVPALRHELHFGRMLRCLVERPSSVAAMLARAAAERPEGEALVCGEVRLDWRGLQHAAARCAGGLKALGVQPGDRVALMLPNGCEFVVVALACAWLGAIVQPVHVQERGDALAHVLIDGGAVALVCAADVAAHMPPPERLPELRWRLAHASGAGLDAGGLPPGFEPLHRLMQAQPLAQPHAAGEDDVVALLYTSGTTGTPKGAMLTQLNVAHSVCHYQQAMALRASDRTIAAVPLSHVTGLVAQLYTFVHVQATLVVMPVFKAREFLRLAAAERLSCALMVPAMYHLCLLERAPRGRGLAHWRLAAFGGSAMPAATIEALAERWPQLTLMNVYGATETTSPATLVPAGAQRVHGDSIGVAVISGDVLVVDEAGREQPPGVVGELLISGPMVVPGYWRDAEATAREFTGGWWRSGDLGLREGDGFLHILDRRKDVINRGGFKVYCVGVENLLAEHPDVIEAALVGVPCAVLGERVHAFVRVRRAGTCASALAAHCAGRVARDAVPEAWTISAGALPRSANGKLMKRVLRDSLHAALS